MGIPRLLRKRGQVVVGIFVVAGEEQKVLELVNVDFTIGQCGVWNGVLT